MTGDIRIGHWTVGDFRTRQDALLSLRDPHGYLTEYGARWRELVLSNPLAENSDPAISLVLDGDVVVGRLVYYAGQYRLESTLRRTFWFQALGLEPAYRSTGVGGALLIQANQRVGSFSGAGMPSVPARRIYEALGAVRLGPLPRFAAILDPEHLYYRHTSSPSLAWLAGTVTKPILRVQRGYNTRNLSRTAQLEFREVSRLQSSLDEILLAEGRYRMFCGVATLNWVLDHRDFMAYEVWRDRALAGYVLFKLTTVPITGSRRARTASVLYLADFHLADQEMETRRELLAFGLKLAAERRVARFETQVKGDPLEHVCRAAGLLELEGNAAYVKPVSEDRKLAADVSRWFLTLGSADVILCLGKDGGADQ